MPGRRTIDPDTPGLRVICGPSGIPVMSSLVTPQVRKSRRASGLKRDHLPASTDSIVRDVASCFGRESSFSMASQSEKSEAFQALVCLKPAAFSN
jgi:hypothetical protein